jgi:beta-glucosidase
MPPGSRLPVAPKAAIDGGNIITRWSRSWTSRAALIPAAVVAVGSLAIACAGPRTGTGAGTRPAVTQTAAAALPIAVAGPTLDARTKACPWLNQSLSVSKRVKLLMARMTLANKITMVEGRGRKKPYVFTMAGQPRLCIPRLGLEDGPNGVGDGLKGVTQLPAGVSLAATFDPALARRYGAVVGAEEWGKGAAVDLGPTVNIDRDPRWGRSFETYTEDPYLNGQLAVSEIDGLQSTGDLAQVKHFAVYNQETHRNTPADDAIIADRTLHEIYLPAFYDAVTEAKVASVMCSYSTINGHYACEDPYLEKTTLDQRWHFPGFVTSDYGALHSVTGAVDGTDMEQPFAHYFGTPLEHAIQKGTIKVSVLNGMVSRILTEMFRFNLFNHPPTGTMKSKVTTTAHQAVSTQVAEAGTVLLKNVSGTLPLSATDGGSIAVIGPSASASPTYGGGGSARVVPPFTVTPLAGLSAAAGSGTTVSYQQGLPTDTSLPAIPSADLSPAYTPTKGKATYTGTLTAPETGTYVLALENRCGCYSSATLSVSGHAIINNPGTPPVSTYSASVSLVAGHAYPVKITGNSAALAWGTPSALAPGIARAVAAAKAANTAVVVVSDDTESEAADRPDLRLPSAQDELISAVAEANPRTVVVVDAGAPVVMPWLNQVDAVVDAWYPGESNGTALASVLFGTTDPSGHLPVTFPASLAQVPAHTTAQFPGENGKVHYSEGLDVGYRWYDAKNLTPLFPFGYGLSYTQFQFSGLKVSPARLPTTRSGATLVKVTARITNTGKVAGADVAQLYLSDPAKAGEPPRQLKGFDRVSLKPGQSAQVTFALDAGDLSYWKQSANAWVVAPGTFHVLVGDSSALASLPLSGQFTVSAS